MSIKEEVQASAAAHRDLGSGYETAIAEGLVERIGEEIDKRVDARLYRQTEYLAGRPRPPRERVPGRLGFGAVMLGLGSMSLAIGATAVVLHPGDGPSVNGSQGFLVTLIWIAIAAINICYARRP